MGPYCKFCDQRCFTHMPLDTPPHVVAAYRTVTILATCPAGQRFERERVGYCLDDIRALLAGAAPEDPRPHLARDAKLERERES